MIYSNISLLYSCYYTQCKPFVSSILRLKGLNPSFPGEKYPHPRSLVHRTVHGYEAAVLLNNHIDLGEPKAGTSRLAGIKWVEDVLDFITRNTFAGINDIYDQIMRVEADIHHERALAGHGFAG